MIKQLQKLSILSLFIFYGFNCWSQNDAFYRYFEYYSTKDSDTMPWSSWIKTDVIIVFNSFKDQSIKILYPNGTSEILRSADRVETTVYDDGSFVQHLTLRTSNGQKMLMAYFDSGVIAFSDFKGFYIRYANKK